MLSDVRLKSIGHQSTNTKHIVNCRIKSIPFSYTKKVLGMIDSYVLLQIGIQLIMPHKTIFKLIIQKGWKPECSLPIKRITHKNTIPKIVFLSRVYCHIPTGR